MDEDHYWANWTNACPFAIDSVYVVVNFSGRSVAGPIKGLWALHFVAPGAHQVTRLSTPASLADFDSVRVRKITTGLDEALLEDPGRQYMASGIDPRLVADPGPPAPASPAAFTKLTASPLADPPSAREHDRRGRELLNQGNYRAAIEELSKAIREKPAFAAAYNARGFAHYLLHEYPRALADLDEAIRLDPRYRNAYQNRSFARKAYGDSTGGTADEKKARALAKPAIAATVPTLNR